MEPVKCKDCGLLAVRSLDDAYVYPADELVRRHGKTKGYTRGSGSFVMVSDRLICFKGIADFESDLQSKSRDQVIHQERDCPHFVQFVPGLTPERHHDMTLLEQVQAINARERAEDLRMIRRNFWVSVASVVVSLLAIIVSAVVAVWVAQR